MPTIVIKRLALVALASLLLVACSSAPGYSGLAHGPKVGIVGDSITNLIKDDLHATVGAKYHYLVRARNGKRIDEQLGALSSILDADDPPKRVIVNLGTNDVLQRRSDAVAHLDEELKVLADVPCVILVTISGTADYGRGHLSADLNAAMKAAVAAHPNFHLLDWAAMLAADDHRSLWLSPEDAIHPTVAGGEVLAAQYRTALDQDCAAVPVSS